jgi:hypothetical protein|tara:strand:+ start:275 stop:1009 length:735 start_codon:yes stop_codon:yes gene_type:complete
MKYFLVIGIEYKFFQKPANLTVNVGNRFIDTFLLDRDYPCTTDIRCHIDPKVYEKHDKSDWLKQADWIERWDKMEKANLYKIYEIDDSTVKGNLEITVENSNNDYTNGFMNKSSLIKFPIVALFKKDLTKNNCHKFMKGIIQLNDFRAKHKEPELDTILQAWPCTNMFYVLRGNQKYEKSQLSNRHYWLGGDFTAQFTIVERHDTKFMTTYQSGKQHKIQWRVAPDDLFLASCNQLLNIYNEDQ